ncbi:MAG: hypothetical protein Q8N51_01995 [Gammaproteobacteria bacterium]|nr:hypothetical protein [Gammaproteobacteria bacterium]
MTTELEILQVVSDRLTAQGLAFMLTGSFALAFYATPRMTRDLDLVVALVEGLILSKLVWARDGGSELQLRDVRALLDTAADSGYLRDWAARLGVSALLDKASS